MHQNLDWPVWPLTNFRSLMPFGLLMLIATSFRRMTCWFQSSWVVFLRSAGLDVTLVWPILRLPGLKGRERNWAFQILLQRAFQTEFLEFICWKCFINTFIHFHSFQEIQSLDNKIHETVETINTMKIQREFFLSFAKEPQLFINKWIISQSRGNFERRFLYHLCWLATSCTESLSPLINL